MNKPQEKKSPVFRFLFLSAFIFPGLGQLAQGKKRLGLIIMMITLVCVYIVFSQVYSQMDAMMTQMEQTGMVDFMVIQEESERISQELNNPSFIISSYGLFALWIFSIIEVFRKASKK